MLPPGRRRASAFPTLPLLLCFSLLLLTSTAHAAGSVLGLDFGTQHLKAALVKPGIPLEIVLTKDSKRKELAAVAFKPQRDAQNHPIPVQPGAFPERVYGSDALALQGRFPGEVFPNLKPLLGLPWSGTAHAAVEAYTARYPAVRAEQVRELGTTMFKSSAFADTEMPWSVEELLAMELANMRRNAEVMAGEGAAVRDVVITVPPFYTADERRAIGRAAALAGLEVNALVSDGLAVGLDYAKSRTFPEVAKGERPEYHLVFDMGAGSTTATLLRFQARSVKDVGRFNKTVQEVAVVGTGWDRTLGGDNFNQVIVNDYVQKFLAKPAVKSRGISAEEITSNGRLMSRLWKEAERARQILSANTETSSSFEELLPDVDFRAQLTRADFEALTVPFTARVAKPIHDALTAAQLSMADVDSIILFGGAVRTPFVQRALEELPGSSTAKLRSNVNADEAAVFGAAFKAAGLSPSFKVKEIRDSDIAGYAAGMKYLDGEKERRQQLFGTGSPVGHGAATKQVTFKDKKDFQFELYQVINGVERAVTLIQTENLTASVNELEKKFGCEVEQMATKFNIKLSAVDGLPEVLTGSVSCEVEEVAARGGSVGDTVKDWFGFGGKKEQEALKEDHEAEVDGPTEAVEASTLSDTSSQDSEATSTVTTSSSSGTSSSSSSSTTSSNSPTKSTKRIESIPLALSQSAQGNPQPAPAEMHRMRDRLAAFERSDRARYAHEEALNALESYTYSVRDFLANPEEHEDVSTVAQREEIAAKLEHTRAFLESESTGGDVWEELEGLKALVEPIRRRKWEAMHRPEMVEKLKRSLEQTEAFVEMMKGQLRHASEARKKAAEMTAASSSSQSATVAERDDDLAELEEPDTAAATHAEEGDEEELLPKYHSPADFSPYTDLDLDELESTKAAVASWLEEKEAAQEALAGHESPALKVAEIEEQAARLSEVMTDLVYRKMKQEGAGKGKGKKEGVKSKRAKGEGKKKEKSGATAPSSSATMSVVEAEETGSRTKGHDEL
ncbi:MAG: hypothetical protein FE78DRAFT_88073 [Acidomyces sp. 'richmondensis']|nr:MAG: hypothetical protein FE78DRAFT_88073 [Acidomyces sp. 'richmondensis']